MLEQKKTVVSQQRSSKKEPLTDAEATELLARVRVVKIAKGKGVTEKAAGEATLNDLKGPTGGYRAPMIVQGKVLLVGFNAEALGELV